MSNGGWTLVIFDDFEDGTTKGWSAGAVATCGEFSKILGGPGIFGKSSAVSKAVPTPTHTKAKLLMEYIKGDSWDGESGVVMVNGSVVFSKKAQGTVGSSNMCGNWLSDEEKWFVNWADAHTAPTLVVAATSTLDQPADEEWFAIDSIAAWVR